ncbi:MAG: efflux RND transporter permease subunit, partial [Planctomycetes bacterium]|nr:efflux RND transporter permease subunit [Planctomycetota bacterium]
VLHSGEHIPASELTIAWPWQVAALVLGGVIGWLLAKPLNRVLGWSFWKFNLGFDAAKAWYVRAVGKSLRMSGLVLVGYGGLLVLTYFGFIGTPTGFIPMQDKGYLLVNVQLPDAASIERTQKAMIAIEKIAKDDKNKTGIPGVKHTVAIAGQSILLNANAPNFGAMYLMLDDFHERAAKGLTSDVIAARLEDEVRKRVPEASVHVFGAPPVEGLGTAGGFKIIIESRGENTPQDLQRAAQEVVTAGNSNPGLQGLFSSFRADTPWLNLDIDRDQAESMGVSMSELFNTLQVNIGSLYINDFNKFGRTWQVNVQADQKYRRSVSDLKQLKMRNSSGGMVPLAAVSTARNTSGPVVIERYNMYASAAVNGVPGEGTSSGQALSIMEQISASKLSGFNAMKAEWTELALLQLQTGNTAMYVFVLAVTLVFLVLAAQYESWSLPLAVILVVPMCLLCSLVGVNLMRMDVNIFTQIGFIVLVGLASKNAILIVEFARQQSQEGHAPDAATLAACDLRLRPIIMTSFAFILGVVPLAISVGAGAEMRRTLGAAVFSGMLGVTLFGIFLTPVFYFVIQKFAERRLKKTIPKIEGEP